jgi:hypothetical protein
MTLFEFDKLAEADQLKVLTIYGVYLCERVVGGNRIYLYAISSFYIELFHELLHADKGGIRVLKIFDDPLHLETYLEDVDISSIYF